jgi:uncharacterized membrane protein
MLANLRTDLALSFSNMYSGWILWNLFLALVPMLLSYWLFRWSTKPGTRFWWFVLGLYLVFLPNAPYLLTDIIHLIRGIGSGMISTWAAALIFIPLHLFAITLGFEAYVVSLINQAYYLKRQGWQRYTVPVELTVHALCALGVYLGRFLRFNSWDVVTAPGNLLVSTLNALTATRPIFVMVITFVILTVLYWVMKQLTIGLRLRSHYARLGEDGLI